MEVEEQNQTMIELTRSNVNEALEKYMERIPDHKEKTVTVHTVHSIPRYASIDGKVILAFDFPLSRIDENGFSFDCVVKLVFLMSKKKRKQYNDTVLALLKEEETVQ